MEIIVVLILIVVAIAIPAGIMQKQKVDAAWAAAARSLGLTFTPGGFMQRRRIHGSLHGLRAEVTTFTRSSGKHSTTYTRYTVWFRRLGFDLHLTREGFFAGVTKFFGAQDIRVGEGTFDSAVVVKGNPALEHKIVEFLNPARRARIYRLLTSHSEAEVKDDRVRIVTRGAQSNPHTITSRIKDLVRLAQSLADSRDEDAVLQKAMRARDRGQIETALALLGQRTGARKARRRARTTTVAPATPPVPPQEPPPLPPVPEPAVADSVPTEIEPTQIRPTETEAAEAAPAAELEPVEEELLEGELLYLADRREEAKEIFDHALTERPDDAEVRDWAAHTAAPPPAPPPAQAAAEGPAVLALCEELFSSQGSSFAAQRAFEEKYAGATVNWQGTLRSAESYSYDFVFGEGPGTKATFEVHEMPEGLFGERAVLAIVDLPQDALAALEERTGDTMSFSGTLSKLDGLMRNFFITKAGISA